VTGPAANVAEFLLSGKDPDRAALFFLRGQYSYRDLQKKVDAVVDSVRALGYRKGDRILLLGENSFFWIAVYLGLLRAGLVCVPLPGGIRSDELNYVQQITEVRAIFAEESLPGTQWADTARVQVVTDSDIESLAAAGQGGEPFAETEAGDLASLMFTSGSTGRPRGVMISHGNIIANTASIIEYMRLTERDRILVVLPFHYCFGASLLHTHLRAGGSLVMEPRFMYPEVVLQRMVDTACTGFAGVPSHFQVLLRKTNLGARSFPRLRYVQQAGGHMPASAIRDLCAALPVAQIFIMYGQTEATARLSYLPPEYLPDKIGSIGRGIPGVRLRVVDHNGEPVRSGGVGEIVVQGANVTQGYWRAPEETAASFRNGELRTGDLATVDEDGFIYIVDRAKDFLKCGGKRVSCRHLEEELLASGELLEAGIVAIPDEILGEAPMAFVVPSDHNRDGLEERLISFLKPRLPSQFIPRRIMVLTELPKNSAGKVLKRELEALRG
jgi:acyl-CoA synthetase (AMP-forming)/AMP-acid ligase II